MLQPIHEFVWGPGMLALFLIVGMLYTIKIRGFALFGFRKWWKTIAGSLFTSQGKNDEELLMQNYSRAIYLSVHQIYNHLCRSVHMNHILLMI